MNALERDLQSQITDYLDIEMAAGRIYWDRLNSGEKVVRGPNRRPYKIKLCRPGTADLVVLKKKELLYMPFDPKPPYTPYVQDPVKVHFCRIIYLEVKRPGERQEENQKIFEWLVKVQGAEYWIVHDADEVQDLLK